ncbi:TPA: alpha-L-Rha alpha-1,3-L-rhamnosyltransferase [Streptococcus suis]|uniref:rhamnan synthesis F family protein n=1 Tax=Streptococcus suis TaxID=1307 RepID=UPI001ABE896C|nr:rhamnan synthesis F family protein [Streptococcus suis]MBO4108791.1 alpha-L-Rha alpha-1,3-L-rhamnosyltransferase [Streptococcus suis]HEM3667656.1 alpha-L-Rha alpha-1,3-L-rhamnosyltransferase [Streptococcus suis]HEM3722548.1 alpha-L-Rha alpha-1,3-L-rhamnosyltransferase [Streptococcus suis]
MKRLLLYVHFNKFNRLSTHVEYQLSQMRPLFSKIIFISNSDLVENDEATLRNQRLVDGIIRRENVGFDFAAWRDGMSYVGFEELKHFDSVTLMNDTCFGPLWDMREIYDRFEQNPEVDFWGMTNFRANKQFKEHIQSYYLSFSQRVVQSKAFQDFWINVQNFTDVQDVIDNYETQVTTNLIDAGYRYQTVFNTVDADTTGMLHPDFSYYNPTAILKNKVPFIKVKTIDANQHITPYILQEIEDTTDYPVDLIVSHMSKINYPDFKYLLARKYVSSVEQAFSGNKKVAVHLHVFYVDLLQEFLTAFQAFAFDYDLFITTDHKEKVAEIEEILVENSRAAEIVVTGNIGRDVLPMLKLKEDLQNYDYVGHFHTKKSKEADFWAGESWRKELITMLVIPANTILANLESKEDLGLVIADIPTFFRFNKIVDAYNENQIVPAMNELWQKMGMTKPIDFNAFHTFVMSYGTYVWFKYDALKPLFDLDLSDKEVPAEPLPQNSILHAIERLLVYIAWGRNYDFLISKNPSDLTAFIDNKLLNERGDALPHTYVNFDHLGGIRGALKYIIVGPARAFKYIFKRCLEKIRV